MEPRATVSRPKQPIATPWTNPVAIQAPAAPSRPYAPRPATEEELLAAAERIRAANAAAAAAAENAPALVGIAAVLTSPVPLNPAPSTSPSDSAPVAAASTEIAVPLTLVAPTASGLPEPVRADVAAALPPAPSDSIATGSLPVGHPVLRPSTGEPRRSNLAPSWVAAPPRSIASTRPQPGRGHRLKKVLSTTSALVAVAAFFASVTIPALDVDGSAVASDALGAVTSTQSLGAASLKVASNALGTTIERENYSATDESDLEAARANEQMIANFDAYMASGAQELGDDYPWFSQLSNNQGGGLSPLNYYYRECVDFVAWRLNRDAGSTTAPFKWDWSYLTPGGGSAPAWKRNWEIHGWETGSEPRVGAVAWFGFHVGYVSAVNDDGTVLIEEYNFQSDHLYGQRTIPADEVTEYLYAPPR